MVGFTDAFMFARVEWLAIWVDGSYTSGLVEVFHAWGCRSLLGWGIEKSYHGEQRAMEISGYIDLFVINFYAAHLQLRGPCTKSP